MPVVKFPAMTTSVGIIIRPALEGDLGAILRVYNHEILTGVATWDEVPWTMEQRLKWFHDHDDSQPLLVAEAHGEAIGFACLTRMSAKSGWRFTREDTIYIDRRHQGRGIGRALLEALLDRGRDLGFRLIVASIESTNVPSIALHASLGFREIGTLYNAGYKFGRWLDTTYMQLDLGPSS